MVVDTSVWIEFFTASESTADHWLTERIAADLPLVVPEVVLMELRVGTTDESKAPLWRQRVDLFVVEPLNPIEDPENAAAIDRRCRRAGKTIRNLIDCQIAAMALRLDVAVAHRDRDFEVIATHAGRRLCRCSDAGIVHIAATFGALSATRADSRGFASVCPGDPRGRAVKVIPNMATGS